ncbi:MAG: NADH-quinone oxidoreductase subunit L [Acidimicrobiia bacterium]|nr:NADH-quinone oxidoreductase subunit L [Acidimicrobiia bacterium]
MLIGILLALPLAGFLVLLFFGKRFGEPAAGYLGTATVGISFLLALLSSFEFISGGEHGRHIELFEWIPSLGLNAELLWDPLSAMMTMVVTGVGTLIHIYSIGYMHGDPRFGRFFTYLNLFITSMLILVLGANFGILFVGWELVGLSSYLLISFWFEKPSAAAAGKKAFVVNRIGDFGFLIALMIIFASFGTLDFTHIFEVLHDDAAFITTATATAITLLLLVGAAGKSAQLPLYVWLPDAMEGPTPVSALIHAATMVTAGVYMVARTGIFFELAPTSQAVVATVGALTALFAATIAIGQRDIKRVLAYSTISQLGYMFMGVGVLGLVAGVFHLVTHAFFKALLFLGAGSVIHAMGGEQDMAKMGGLRKKIPVTFATMVVAWIAISGIPPLAGFWSKDEILAVVYGRGGGYMALWIIGIITAGLTAFYMSRMMFLTFWGDPRWDEGVEPHESPVSMTMPLAALAGLSVVGGLINTPFRPALEHFLEPAFEFVHQAHIPEGITPWILAAISIGVGVLGLLYAYRRYVVNDTQLEEGGVWDTLLDGYGVDDFYGETIVAPGKALSEQLAFIADAKVVDGGVNGIGALVKRLGTMLTPLQTGLARNYGVGILAGAVGLVVWLIVAGGAV